MSESAPITRSDLAEAYRRFRAFRGDGGGRLFECPTPHPSEGTGFCPCEGSWAVATWFYIKGALLSIAFHLPFNALRVWLLRRLGARVGKKVYLSIGAWIDPTFPELLTIEDNVFVGTGARLAFHEFAHDAFRAGRVCLRRGSFVGGWAVIRCGVEVGENAVVAACAVVARDVPPGCTAISPPAKIIRREPCPQSLPPCDEPPVP